MNVFHWFKRTLRRTRARTSLVTLAAATLLALASGLSTGSLLPTVLRDPTTSSGIAAPGGYMPVTDASEKIRVTVPVQWRDVDDGDWFYRGERVGVFLSAATHLGDFNARRPAPGVFIGISHMLAQRMDDKGLLTLEKDDFGRTCRYAGRFDYRDKFYAGAFDQFAGCSQGNHHAIVLTTTSADRNSIILVRITAVTEADLKAASRVLETFQVLGDPEQDDHPH